MRPAVTFSLIALCSLVGVQPSPSAEWHHPFYLPGDGYWQGRVRVVAWNETDRAIEGHPAGVRVGKGPGEADLAGQAVERMRACTQSGVEVLFGLAGPDGMPIDRGPIPAPRRSTWIWG